MNLQIECLQQALDPFLIQDLIHIVASYVYDTLEDALSLYFSSDIIQIIEECVTEIESRDVLPITPRFMLDASCPLSCLRMIFAFSHRGCRICSMADCLHLVPVLPVHIDEFPQPQLIGSSHLTLYADCAGWHAEKRCAYDHKMYALTRMDPLSCDLFNHETDGVWRLHVSGDTHHQIETLTSMWHAYVGYPKWFNGYYSAVVEYVERSHAQDPRALIQDATCVISEDRDNVQNLALLLRWNEIAIADRWVEDWFETMDEYGSAVRMKGLRVVKGRTCRYEHRNRQMISIAFGRAGSLHILEQDKVTNQWYLETIRLLRW
jgi:hypothetical protein